MVSLVLVAAAVDVVVVRIVMVFIWVVDVVVVGIVVVFIWVVVMVAAVVVVLYEAGLLMRGVTSVGLSEGLTVVATVALALVINASKISLNCSM